MSTFSTVARFLEAKTVPAGISTIYSGGLPIDLLVSPGTSDATIFFFHGAIEREFTLPVLSGLGISGGLTANRVFISDPSLSLDEDLLLSWYAGNHQQPDLQQTLVRILKKVSASLASDRVVFFGGSGGGFASLFFASHFQDSLALVFNPQTNIAKYSERAVRDFAEKAFQVPAKKYNPLSALPSEVVLDVVQLYQEPKSTRIAYLQNLNDKSHVKSHLVPFAQAINPQTRFLVMKEPWRQGHLPPPKDLLSTLLNLTTSSEDWEQDFTDIGFVGMER